MTTERLYKKLPVDELFSEIDEAIEEANAGMLQEADSIVEEIATEFGLVAE